MRNIKFILASVLASTAFAASAQDLTEAYNLSNLTVQGTARSIGFGGALGSVGGDFSSLSVNPAGLGVYRSSELSFTPSLKVNSASGDFLANTTSDNNVRLNINNFGVVFTDAPKGRRYERRQWKAVSFALGVNRVADFNHDYSYSGVNRKSSASQAFEADANMDSVNINIAGTLAYMGAVSGLLGGHFANYKTVVPFAGGITQLNNVSERGGINEYVISLGGNYQEKLLIGATLGLPYVNYTRNSDYTETVTHTNTSNPANFQSFNYNNSLNISGGGANIKLGVIYKLTNFFRIGAAFHSPTYYNLHDVMDYGISSVVNGNRYSVSTANDLPQNVFDYSFTTPLKSVLSATFILKHLGFITADYEYVDYSTMKFHYPTGYDEASGLSYAQEAASMNRNIKNMYQSANNLRLGAEIKLSRFFMVRGGVGYYGNPYKSPDVSSERMDVSAGLGFRTKTFFADFAVVNSSYKFTEQAYSQVDYSYVPSGPATTPPVATVTNNVNNIAVTMGVKF